MLAASRLGTMSAPRPDGKPFNPYALTDEELEETKRLLIEQKKLLLTRYQDYDALDRLMRGGSVWAAPEFAETYRHLTVLAQGGQARFRRPACAEAKGRRARLGRHLDDQLGRGLRARRARPRLGQSCSSPRRTTSTVVRSTGYGGTVDVRDQLTPDEIELYFQNRSAEASQLHMFDQPSSPEKWERIWSDVEAS